MATIVQTVLPDSGAGGPVNTATHTFAAAAAGDLLVDAISIDKDAGTITLGTGGTGWTLEPPITGASGGGSARGVSGAVAWKVATGGETSLQWNWNSTTARYWSGIVREWSGWAQAPTLDTKASTDSGLTTVPSIATGTTAALSQDALCVAMCGIDSRTSASSFTWSPGTYLSPAYSGNNTAFTSAPPTGMSQKDGAPSGGAESATSSWATADEAWATMLAFVPSTGGAVTYEQVSYRGRNDDGSESAATWKAAANTNWTQTVNQNVRVRFLVRSGSQASAQNRSFQLRYSRATGGGSGSAYVAVTGSSSVVRSSASPNVADGAATTEQLAGAQAFNAGTFDENDGAAAGYTATPALNDDTEVEYCFQIRGADVANGDTISLRLYDGTTALTTYTATPSMTVSGASAANVQYPRLGAMSHNGFTVGAKFSSATNVRLVVSTGVDLDVSPVYSTSQTVDADGRAKASVTGLSASTFYYYGWEVDGTVVGTGRGTATTFGAPAGDALSFNFSLCSCAESNPAPTNHTIFSVLQARNPLLHIMQGDMHYEDVASTLQSDYYTAYDLHMSAGLQADFYGNVPNAYIWSDHDFCGNGSYSASTGATTVPQVYRKVIPSYPLEQSTTTEGIYHTFEVGRVRFIMLDTRRYASNPANTDNSSKTLLGATQKAWLKSVCLANPNQLKFVVGDSVWIGTLAGEDNWAGFTTERSELTTYFSANSITNVIYCGGDSHMIAADDGTNTPGSPNVRAVFQGAPFDRPSSMKGWSGAPASPPYSQGIFPTTTNVQSQQYGWVEITDTGGTTIHVTYQGYDENDTTLITALAFDVTVPSSFTTEALRPNAALTLTKFTGAYTDIDADPDTTPVTDAGLTPVVE